MSCLLSSSLFCLVLLVTLPVISHAKAPIPSGQTSQELTAEAKDIRIIDESGEEISVSTEDIRSRLINGNSLHFVKDQKEEKRTIEADWITKALKSKKPVDIKNAIIIGDLDLRVGKPVSIDSEELNSVLGQEGISELKTLRVDNVYLVSSPIRIAKSILKDNLIAGWKEKRRDVVVFLSNTDFVLAQFSGEETHFTGAKFSGETDFGGAKFSGEETNFVRAQFSGKETNFGEAKFSGEETNFRWTKFSGKTNFGWAKFSGEETDFGWAQFSGKETNFGWAQFSGKTFFKRTQFKSKNVTYFNNSHFDDVVHFIRASFKHRVDFRDATFDKSVLFSKANFAENVKVDLRDTIYTHLHISWPQLERRLDTPLQELSDTLEARNKAEADKFFQWQEVYRRLIRNFEDIGDRKSAHAAYYHYRHTMPKFKIANLGSNSAAEYIVRHGWLEKTQEWFWRIVIGWTCGYGVKVERPLFAGGIIIAIFTIVYFVGYYFKKTCEKLEMMPVKIPKRLRHKIKYDETKKLLTVKGLMTREEMDELLSLPKRSNKKYQKAVEELFKTSGPLYYPQGERNPLRENWYHKLGNSFYGSFVTFSTLGLGGVMPSGWFKAAVICEGVFGWFTLALFLATLANVLLR